MSTEPETPPQEPAAEVPAEAPAEAQTPAPAEPVNEAPVPAEEPVAETPAPAEEPVPPAAEPVAETPTPAEESAPPAAEPVADAPAPADEPAPPTEAPAEPVAAEATTAEAPKPAAEKPVRPKRKRNPKPRRPNVPKDLPRTRAPLPLDELRDASRATLDLFGQKGIRDAFLILAPRERQDISALIANEEDHRPRTRNIANGSIGAGRIDKAMSATIISMARVEDLWAIVLDKESAAEKIGRIRAAKQADKQKAERAKERANRSDRVSREDMAKARDGSVGATIRIVTDEKRERRPKGEPPAEKPKRESVLDQLGY